MNWSKRLLAVGAAAIAAGLPTASPAEAHRPFHHGFFYPAIYPRPVFYPRAIFVPPPPPVYVVRPVVYLPPPPPPVAYGYGYHSGYAHRKPVKKRYYRKASRKPACQCPQHPPAAPGPAREK